MKDEARLLSGELDQRRSREIEIDVLIAHEFASGSPAAELLWRRAGLPSPGASPKVEYQQLCGDGRVADVRVSARGGRQLLIEDKAAGGSFQPGQVENYAGLRSDTVRTVLVAPASFVATHRREAGRFSAAVTLEEIAEALRPPKGAGPELTASYAHRREEFLRCARDPGWVGNPDEGVRAFGDLYRRLAEEVTGGEVALTPRTLSNAAARMVEFVPWAAHDNLKPFHKLDKGLLDVRVKGFSLAELRERLDSAGSRERCPEGWQAAAQGTSKYPVMRRRVGMIGGQLSGEAFEEVRPTVVEALEALASLKSWWERRGEKLLGERA